LLLKLGEWDEAHNAYAEAERLRQGLVQNRPDDADACFQLNRSYFNAGQYARWVGDPATAWEAFRKARAAQENLVESHPTVAEYQADLVWTCAHLAELALDDGRPADAAEPLQRARDLVARLARNAPANASVCSDQARVLVDLAKLALVREEPVVAEALLEEASRILDRFRPAECGPEVFYAQALIFALRGELAGMGKTAPTPEEQEARRSSADAALNCLRRAVDSGFRNVEQLKRDIGFRSLRDHKGFRELIDDLNRTLKRV
jgi:tetratricopeptide (TPR) repeat protein